MNIVLLEPEIPMNTGNIGRTCVATNSSLHLIRPLGFSIDEKSVRRSGLDYWKDLNVRVYDNFEHFVSENNPKRIIMATTKAKKLYTDMKYEENDFIMFGKESKGIPENILKDNYENCVRIPMYDEYRSLNLSNSVAIILYETLRQQNFLNLRFFGEFHNL